MGLLTDDEPDKPGVPDAIPGARRAFDFAGNLIHIIY
jgi:hypothetical protein